MKAGHPSCLHGVSLHTCMCTNAIEWCKVFLSIICNTLEHATSEQQKRFHKYKLTSQGCRWQVHQDRDLDICGVKQAPSCYCYKFKECRQSLLKPTEVPCYTSYFIVFEVPP